MANNSVTARDIHEASRKVVFHEQQLDLAVNKASEWDEAVAHQRSLLKTARAVLRGLTTAYTDQQGFS